MARDTSKINYRSLNQLCDKYSVPRGMGELFLSEIKLSTEPENKHFRDAVALLGL